MMPFAECCVVVEAYIERRYGIHVSTVDASDALIGDLNGAEIRINSAASPEQRFFLLLHLFGHTVHWNLDPRAVEIGRLRQHPLDDEAMSEIRKYEREASMYALGMAYELGLTWIDQWFSDYAACDMAYMEHYYVTAERQTFVGFWRDNCPLIEPRSVPEFTPTQRAFRRGGVVI